MARHIEDEVSYYYDSHPTEEDLMGETSVHADLVHYLFDVLNWLFAGQLCAIYKNLNFYLSDDEKEYPIAPDIAVIKGINRRRVRSWRVGRSGPAPQVVFEIASDETWRNDLMEKPAKYALMGAQEYFAYDPNEPPVRRSAPRRLYGWRLDAGSGTMREMPLSANGALWSEQLESWLVPDGAFLRLYDRDRQLRLTKVEAESMRAAFEARRAAFEAERAKAEAQRSQQLAEKLRSLGIDPDQL